MTRRPRSYWIPLIIIGLQAVFGVVARAADREKHYAWWWLGVLGFAVLTVGLAVASTLRTREARDVELEKNMLNACWKALTGIARDLDVSTEHLGVHVYFVQPKRWWCRWGAQIQRRVTRVTMQRRQGSPAVWPKGKGVVGLCWGAGGESPTHWTRGPKGEGRAALAAQRLTAGDIERTMRYAGIYAYPVRREEAGKVRYIGCVSVDCVSEDDWAKMIARRDALDLRLGDVEVLAREA